MNKGLTLNELAALFEAAVIGDGSHCVVRATEGVAAAKPGELVFVEATGQLEACAKSNAAVLALPSVVEHGGSGLSVNGLACAEPRLHFHVANRLLIAHDDLAEADGEGVWIAKSATVHESARLAPGCVVLAGACIHANAVLYPGAVIEKDASVGAGAIIRSRAVIARDTVIGPLCDIGSGSVIGADPQEFEAANGVWTRKPGKTRVRLGKRVAIGANSVIESGARRETRIESDVLIGGQVYIAHDCEIDKGVLIIGQSGLASGVRIENGAALMGRVAVDVDVQIGPGALVLAMSAVTKDVSAGARVWGNPARSRNEALRRLHRQMTDTNH
ncbi:hypothetical protein QTI66_01890 [Variovorax sp. J22R133]|uniref:hypothetical protein n=1 Tax=Variovorax brevis TaxID=3053503 RepID=UPI00257557D8|nr:hypothetical protein [Variovorax sp. J22R133]MDM0110877.1 hypothetical protein [Variovorax sp. J22R133]